MKRHYQENAGPVIRNIHKIPHFATGILVDAQNLSSHIPIVKEGVFIKKLSMMSFPR